MTCAHQYIKSKLQAIPVDNPLLVRRVDDIVAKGTFANGQDGADLIFRLILQQLVELVQIDSKHQPEAIAKIYLELERGPLKQLKPGEERFSATNKFFKTDDGKEWLLQWFEPSNAKGKRALDPGVGTGRQATRDGSASSENTGTVTNVVDKTHNTGHPESPASTMAKVASIVGTENTEIVNATPSTGVSFIRHLGSGNISITSEASLASNDGSGGVVANATMGWPSDNAPALGTMQRPSPLGVSIPDALNMVGGNQMNNLHHANGTVFNPQPWQLMPSTGAPVIIHLVTSAFERRVNTLDVVIKGVIAMFLGGLLVVKILEFGMACGKS